MKRILLSILLLVVALLMSKSFSAELQNFTPQTQPVRGYALAQNDLSKQNTLGAQVHFGPECLCDPSLDNPTFTLVLIAAVMASFTMAIFIYGSQFIATLVAG